MNRGIIWCLGCILALPLACQRDSGTAETGSAASRSSADGRAEPVAPAEEVPARAEEAPPSGQALGRTETDSNARAKQILAQLERQSASLRNEITLLERQMAAASATEAWTERLKAIQKEVAAADAKIGALKDVRELNAYSQELRDAQNALRASHESVDDFRSELKMSMESKKAAPE